MTKHPRQITLPLYLVSTLATWAERGPLPPLLARLSHEPPWPMKIGIHLDLVARYPGVPEDQALDLLRMIAGMDSYCRACLASGAMRHDLDGNQTGPVSDVDQKQAVARLAGNKAFREKRKAAKTAAAPPSPPPRLGRKGRPILSLKVAVAAE